MNNKKVESAPRKELDNILFNKLPDILSDKQKVVKIKNLLYEMKYKDFTVDIQGENRKFKMVIKIDQLKLNSIKLSSW